jgi:hypothetical protein
MSDRVVATDGAIYVRGQQSRAGSRSASQVRMPLPCHGWRTETLRTYSTTTVSLTCRHTRGYVVLKAHVELVSVLSSLHMCGCSRVCGRARHYRASCDWPSDAHHHTLVPVDSGHMSSVTRSKTPIPAQVGRRTVSGRKKVMASSCLCPARSLQIS